MAQRLIQTVIFLSVFSYLPHLTTAASAQEAVSDSGRHRVAVSVRPEIINPGMAQFTLTVFERSPSGAWLPVTGWMPVSARPERGGDQRPVESTPFLDASGTPVTTGRSISTYLWMDMGHHSHSTAPTRTLPAASAGEIRVENAFFTMPGIWQMHVIFRDGTQFVDHAVLNINVERRR